MTNFTAVQTASGTSSGTAATVTFGSPVTAGIPIRYSYIAVTNTGTAGFLYVRTDGTAATVGGDLCTVVAPGLTEVIANALPLWTQAANVIQTGTLTGTAAGTGTPQEMVPNGTSLYGQKTSPGTSVSIISGGTPTYVVSGTG